MSSHSYVNGEYKANYLAKISINDRSFHFADAVYEVVAVHNKNLLFWSDHITRLKRSVKSLGINFKKNPKKINYFYVLTPAGITAKTKLTINFMKRKMKEYDELKKELE